jgi:hypothetical protein
MAHKRSLNPRFQTLWNCPKPSWLHCTSSIHFKNPRTSALALISASDGDRLNQDVKTRP